MTGRQRSSPTPASLGFRHCAEWEPHEATWIGWPHNVTDWPGKFATIPWACAEIVRGIAPGERVRILVNSAKHESSARRTLLQAGVDLSHIQFFRFPTNRGWTRDFGPIFLRRSLPKPEVAIAAFRFNAWARYPDFSRDARIHERAAAALKLQMFTPCVQGRRVVLEGGAVDFNGTGSMLTTEECLLDRNVQVRNPGASRKDLEHLFADFFGVSNVLWLARGIAGDDTHGHVDDLCRFVGPSRVVLCEERNVHEVNYAALQENRERLEGMHTENGSKLDVVPLPMPSPLFFGGRRLPASYANFYFSNHALLVPTFNDPNDRVALGILSELVDDRVVVGIHALDLVWGFGTLHCLTHEQPAC